MKKFRPYCAGFIVLYALSLLCFSEAVYTLISQLRGVQNSYIQSFSIFSYLIAICAIFFTKMYAVSRVEVDDKSLRFVNPVYIIPAAGAKRAMILYRSGNTDIKLVDKKFRFEDMLQYGYIEDLNYKRLDRSSAGPNNKLFPVQEIAFVMKDGKRYHMNGAFYSAKQLSAIITQVNNASGIAPTGKLSELVAK